MLEDKIGILYFYFKKKIIKGYKNGGGKYIKSICLKRKFELY